jgi:hypothetical protein
MNADFESGRQEFQEGKGVEVPLIPKHSLIRVHPRSSVVLFSELKNG